MTNIGYPTFPGLHEAIERLNDKIGGNRHIEQLWRDLVDREAVAELAVGSRDGFGPLLSGVTTIRRTMSHFSPAVDPIQADLWIETLDAPPTQS